MNKLTRKLSSLKLNIPSLEAPTPIAAAAAPAEPIVNAVNAGVFINTHGGILKKPNGEYYRLTIPPSIFRKYSFFISTVGCYAIMRATTRFTIEEQDSAIQTIFKNNFGTVPLDELMSTDKSNDTTASVFFSLFIKLLSHHNYFKEPVLNEHIDESTNNTFEDVQIVPKKANETIVPLNLYDSIIKSKITIGNTYINKIFICDNDFYRISFLSDMIWSTPDISVTFPKTENILSRIEFIDLHVLLKMHNSLFSDNPAYASFDYSVVFLQSSSSSYRNRQFEDMRESEITPINREIILKETTFYVIYKFLSMFKIDRLFIFDATCNVLHDHTPIPHIEEPGRGKRRIRLRKSKKGRKGRKGKKTRKSKKTRKH